MDVEAIIKDKMKQQAALAALDYIQDDMVVGVGTGSTVNYFIDALASIKHKITGAVASSNQTKAKLVARGIPIWDLNAVNEVPVYVDGADEINASLQMIKGGGGALTGEKIVASVAKKFICIADQTKRVDKLGQFPVAVEVIPMARSYVARELVKLGGDPIYREGFVSDYGNVILDVYNFSIIRPLELEERINNISGVVTSGIFAKRPADMLLLATEAGVQQFK